MARDSTIADLDQLHKFARSARSRLEPIWYLNLAYYMGEQWVAWDGRALFRPRLKANRITIVDNRIQPVVRTEIAKMTKSRPVFNVSPRTSDEEDLNASEMGEQLMRYLWEHLSLQEKMNKALHWSRICGAGFVKTFWNPALGDGTDVVVGPNGSILRDSKGKSLRPGEHDPAEISQQMGMPVRSKRVNQGDISVEVRSPFQMFIDPLCDTFSEAEWLIEETVQSQEVVEQRYGKLIQTDTVANPGLIEARMGAVLAGAGQYKGVKVREYWCKPSSQHPKGRRMVWSKDTILQSDDSPFDPMPYIMLSGIPIPGRLWPTSVVEQLRGPQTELNKVKSQIAENRNRVGNPTILASKQAVQDPAKFESSTTMPGGIYYFDDLGSPNTVPTYLQAPPLPQYVIDEIQRIEESIQEISGQHEVTSAQVPPGVTAASAINLLMEADDTRIGPAVTDYEYHLGRFGQKILKLAAHYYTDARTIRIAGDNGSWQIYDFRGSMLRDNTHVEVQAGSAFPQSKAAKQAAMQDLLTFFAQSGNPPHGRQLAQFLKDWGVGAADRLIEEYTLDQTQAERENTKMFQGQPVEINDFDNDQAHIDAHQDEQKSQHFEQQQANVKMMFHQHVAAHKARLSEQQAQQAQLEAQQAQQAKAGPPEQQMADLQQQQQEGAQGAQEAATANQGAQQEQAQGADAAALQQAITAAQAQHGIETGAAQKGHQMSMAHEQHQQSQNTARQAQQHAAELHAQKVRHAEAVHAAKLKQMAAQAKQQAQQIPPPSSSGGK